MALLAQCHWSQPRAPPRGASMQLPAPWAGFALRSWCPPGLPRKPRWFFLKDTWGLAWTLPIRARVSETAELLSFCISFFHLD